LENRVILITGVTRGLGRAVAGEFVRMGHTVVGGGRSEKNIAELTRELPGPNHFTATDVSSDDQVKAWAEKVLSTCGPPDLLINNAGVINRMAKLWDLSPAEFDSVIDINVKGVVNVIRHFAPAMIRRQSGVIVNMSSGWGRSTSPEVAPYCASKWAIEGLTRSLAEELPTGMAAVSLNPGIIDTDMLRTSWGEEAGQYPPPSEWARQAAPFLLRLGPLDNGKALSVPGH